MTVIRSMWSVMQRIVWLPVVVVLATSAARGQGTTPVLQDAPAAVPAPSVPSSPGTVILREGPSELMTPTPPGANVPANKPLIPEYQRKSGQRAGGPANELNDGRHPENLPGGSVAGAVSGRELYHGNYCGRGSRGGGTLPPEDDLDAACMR